MVKLLKNHNIYEVWCKYTAESVYVLGKPTKKELEQIRKENWPGTDQRGNPFPLIVFKERRVYKKTNICSHCSGKKRVQEGGSLSPFVKCDVCKGTGYQPEPQYCRNCDISHTGMNCPWCGGIGKP